ncbi:uncharacterized protein SCODWIG_02764 [Saccharomycodes ludwigii]|uniref:DUF3074 domain-containing protein n=1 Tax=Saccharomycodes ludwigii TaxID=36035 RepID=A0A376B8I1_9ASCO|nr:hypothetical protein SCDLUD_000554 [Saccharomycodes ludwigii]KAH3902954.1 hypothetical protein SCDLUD_000554 [Saccharomycodes ludwigii]SSD61003.1 uncharacterized protein SCODWIG_02764 [Saccharomycodes ludwigii]
MSEDKDNTFDLLSKQFNVDDLSHDEKKIKSKVLLFTNNILTSWKKGKDYDFVVSLSNINKDTAKNAKVQTYYNTIKGDYWVCRYSTHSEISESMYKEKIIKYLNGSNFTTDNVKNDLWELQDPAFRIKMEKNYIHTIKDCKILDTSGGWVLSRMLYSFGKPLNDRVFYEWVYIIKPYRVTTKTIPEEQKEEEISFVISLPAKYNNKENNDNKNAVRGIYCSVERLSYNYKTKQLKWLMCTTSDAGGYLPKWLQNSMISKSVAKDVPLFLDWVVNYLE